MSGVAAASADHTAQGRACPPLRVWSRRTQFRPQAIDSSVNGKDDVPCSRLSYGNWWIGTSAYPRDWYQIEDANALSMSSTWASSVVGSTPTQLQEISHASIRTPF